MKIEQLREQTTEELVRKTKELKHDMLNMRIQQASGQVENPSRLKLLRREVARIETIISERRLNITIDTSKPKKVKAAKPEAGAATVKKAAKKAAKKATKKAAKATAE